jgi:hypothetical protein
MAVLQWIAASKTQSYIAVAAYTLSANLDLH